MSRERDHVHVSARGSIAPRSSKPSTSGPHR
jgi:hypothetical protein